MINLKNDYSELAHPLVLKSLLTHAFEQNEGYCLDSHCTNAAKILLSQCRTKGEVHFFPGGTAVNKTVINSILRPYEAVICAPTAHINIHETGAIESNGHKVLTTMDEDGKLSVEGILQVLSAHSTEHMVKPALIYLSNSTELGSIYKKEELIAIKEVCDKHRLFLYLDGARLSNALACEENDLTLADIAALTDVFYLGGTKNGALGAEACIITNPSLQEDFRFFIKQNGVLSAKGFVLGLQFEALLKDNLYLKLATHANHMASTLAEQFIGHDYPFLSLPITNQIFPIIPDEELSAFQKEIDFEIWGKADETHTIIRFVTSWATNTDQINDIAKFLENLHPTTEREEE